MRPRTVGLALALIVSCVLVSGGRLPQQKLMCGEPSNVKCVHNFWDDAEEWDGINPQDSVHWADKIDEANWDLDSNAGCAKVRSEAESIFSSVDFWVGGSKGSYRGTFIRARAAGENDIIALSNWYMLTDYNDDIKLDLILHEVGHYAGFDHPAGEGYDWWPEKCGQMPEEKEEEEPGEGGGETPEPVCVDQLVEEYYTVYESRFQRAKVCVSSDVVGGITGDCPWTYRLVDVPVQKVRWVWETVCSS